MCTIEFVVKSTPSTLIAVSLDQMQTTDKQSWKSAQQRRVLLVFFSPRRDQCLLKVINSFVKQYRYLIQYTLLTRVRAYVPSS